MQQMNTSIRIAGALCGLGSIEMILWLENSCSDRKAKQAENKATHNEWRAKEAENWLLQYENRSKESEARAGEVERKSKLMESRCKTAEVSLFGVI